MTKPRVPQGLNVAGRRLWRSVIDNYELSGHELEVLRVAAMAADRLETAHQQLDDEGQVITNRFGALVAHPAAKVAHDAGQTILNTFRSLSLPEDTSAAPIRFGGKPGPKPKVGSARLREVV